MRSTAERWIPCPIRAKISGLPPAVYPVRSIIACRRSSVITAAASASHCGQDVPAARRKGDPTQSFAHDTCRPVVPPPLMHRLPQAAGEGDSSQAIAMLMLGSQVLHRTTSPQKARGGPQGHAWASFQEAGVIYADVQPAKQRQAAASQSTHAQLGCMRDEVEDGVCGFRRLLRMAASKDYMARPHDRGI